MSRFFKLEGKVAVPIPPDDHLRWVTTDPDHGFRIVRLDMLRSGGELELVRVSTVFNMGINHRGLDGADPLIFETRVLGGTMDQAKWRYSTWGQAEVGHQEVLEQLLREMPNLTKVVEESKPIRTTRYARIIRDLRQ